MLLSCTTAITRSGAADIPYYDKSAFKIEFRLVLHESNSDGEILDVIKATEWYAYGGDKDIGARQISIGGHRFIYTVGDQNDDVVVRAHYINM